jgi:hypothetical protein
MSSRPWVNHHAAGECPLRGLIAENEMIAAQSQDRLGQRDLAVRRLLRLDMVPFAEDDDFAKSLGGPQMDPHVLMVLDALARRGPDFQISVEAI